MDSSLRVFVVEDEALLQMQLEIFLEDAGHTMVGCASSMSEALERAPNAGADIVLIDLDNYLLLADTKGPEAAQRACVAVAQTLRETTRGDAVVARYAEALTLELRKTKKAAGGVTMTEDAVTAKPGERPAVAGARQLTLMAEVVAVDPKASTISLKGPKGNVIALNVQNPDQFKVVKKGDHVEVTYTEALALSVEPAPAATTKK